MSNLNLLVVLTLTAVMLPLAQAESHCPGNVNSLPLRLVQRWQIIVPVTINSTGPYDFVLDTGAQFTTVDPSLAAELHLRTREMAEVSVVGVFARAPLTQLDSVEAGSHKVKNVLAVIQNFGQTQLADRKVRGVLGGNFLEHFDLLVDYSHEILCLDDSMQMRAKVKGHHIALSAQPLSQHGWPVAQKLIIPVHLSGIEKRQVLLELDSGTNAPLLYGAGGDLGHLQTVGTSLQGQEMDGLEHAFAVLVGQDVQVGPHSLRQVVFVTPVDAGRTTAKPDVDGLLPTLLFQRVFVDYSDHYVVLESW
jgi:predicted aspartyl protease